MNGSPTSYGECFQGQSTQLIVCVFQLSVVKQYSQLDNVRESRRRIFRTFFYLHHIEHKSMKQVSYSDEYSLSASTAHHSHLQFSFVIDQKYGDKGLECKKSDLRTEEKSI